MALPADWYIEAPGGKKVLDVRLVEDEVMRLRELLDAAKVCLKDREAAAQIFDDICTALGEAARRERASRA